MIDPTLPFRHPSVIPPRRDLYVRDWRGTAIMPARERELHIDMWEPVTDRRSILYPGVWYVLPCLNDASEQSLPWRLLTNSEYAWIMREIPTARDWLHEVDAMGLAE